MSVLQPQLKHINTPNKQFHHHSPLSIHYLLNEEPIRNNELPQSSSYKDIKPDMSNKPMALPSINTLFSSLQTPMLHHTSYQKHIDLWNHHRTGVHRARNGSIVVSSLEKAKRKRILPYQYQCLVQSFEKTDSPSSEMRERLAIELNMTKREVQVWFQNRRAKMNKCRLNK